MENASHANFCMVCGTAVEKSKASADERLANQPLSSAVSNCKHYHLGLRRADGRQFCNDCGSYLTESQLQCGHQNLAPDRTPDGRWRCSDCGFFVGTANNVATLSLSGAGSEIQGKVVETEFRDKTVIVIMGIVLGLLGIIAIVLTVLTHTNSGNPVLDGTNAKLQAQCYQEHSAFITKGTINPLEALQEQAVKNSCAAQYPTQ